MQLLAVKRYKKSYYLTWRREPNTNSVQILVKRALVRRLNIKYSKRQNDEKLYTHIFQPYQVEIIPQGASTRPEKYFCMH